MFFVSRVRDEQILPVLKTLTEDTDADFRYFSDDALTVLTAIK